MVVVVGGVSLRVVGRRRGWRAAGAAGERRRDRRAIQTRGKSGENEAGEIER